MQCLQKNRSNHWSFNSASIRLTINFLKAARIDQYAPLSFFITAVKATANRIME
jgi:hypothetical protein